MPLAKELGGPWILGPPDRETRLLVGVLRSAGYSRAEQTDTLPARGLVVVPARQAHRSAEVRRWLSGGDRAALVEPADGEPVPLSGVPRRLGQRRRSPASQPSDVTRPGDEYLSDVAAIALDGYATRLGRDRPFPSEWRSLAARAMDELIAKAEDPEALKLLREQLGEAAPRASSEDWRTLASRLDMRRGLFRRDGEGDGWDLHPHTLCAIASRIDRYVPSEANPVEYGTSARGSLHGPWVENEGGSLYRLRASVLTSAASELDPPTLSHQYDFSDDALPPPVDEAFEALPERLRPDRRRETPFTLCVRHDVDRPLPADQLDAHVDLEDALGFRSTWFFKRETFDPTAVRRLLESGREVGYHAEILSTGDDGFADELRDFVGEPIGVSFHGGLGSEGWRGRRSLEEAHGLGAAYAELPVGRRTYPQLWPADGDEWLPMAPLPVKLDVYPERVRSHLDALMPGPAMIVVENHPDRMAEGHRSLLNELAERRPVARTVGEAIAAHGLGGAG